MMCLLPYADSCDYYAYSKNECCGKEQSPLIQ